MRQRTIARSVLQDQWVQDTERSPRQLHARALIASQIASGQKTQ